MHLSYLYRSPWIRPEYLSGYLCVGIHTKKREVVCSFWRIFWVSRCCASLFCADRKIFLLQPPTVLDKKQSCKKNGCQTFLATNFFRISFPATSIDIRESGHANLNWMFSRSCHWPFAFLPNNTKWRKKETETASVEAFSPSHNYLWAQQFIAFRQSTSCLKISLPKASKVPD